MKKLMVICLVTSVFICPLCLLAADGVGPNFLNQGSDYEQKVNSKAESIFKGIIYLAICVAAIAVGWGFVEYHGIIGEKEEGVRRIKRGLVGLAASGTILTITAWIAS